MDATVFPFASAYQLAATPLAVAPIHQLQPAVAPNVLMSRALPHMDSKTIAQLKERRTR
jgi:hypothetical protein